MSYNDGQEGRIIQEARNEQEIKADQEHLAPHNLNSSDHNRADLLGDVEKIETEKWVCQKKWEKWTNIPAVSRIRRELGSGALNICGLLPGITHVLSLVLL